MDLGLCTKCQDPNRPREAGSPFFTRDANASGGIRARCKDCESQRKRERLMELKVAAGEVAQEDARAPTRKQADGAKETAEDRAAEIAERIAECAREHGIAPCDLTWVDFNRWAGIAYGRNSIGMTPGDLTRFGGYYGIRNAYFPPVPTDHGVTRLRLREHASLNRRLGSDAIAATFVQQEQGRLAEHLFKGRVEPMDFPASNKPTQRAIVAVLSDLHFGSDIDGNETGHLTYGRVEEARRLAQVVTQIVKYKQDKRDCTELHLVIAGDLIHGKLHDPQDGAAKAEQIMRAVHLLSQAVAQLASKFKRVHVHCVSGNHDRDITRHRQRATSEKWDGTGTVIYSAVRLCTERLTNVTFNIPITPMVVFTLFGRRYFATHGDTVLDAGNPGKSVNTSRLEAQVNRWNASAGDGQQYSVFIVGHVHTPLLHHMANDCWLVVNGCLVPADGYAISLGLPETVSDQVVFEATPAHPVGDFRFITLDRTVDEDESLDAVIKPWTRF